ncbi:MAG: hypothetical protein R6X19_02160 [Kiritimatiellia bacterium]
MGSRAKLLSLVLLGAAALAGLAIACLVAADSLALSPDSVIREALCRRLLQGATEGRQGLVSSLWFAPLPTIARLPLVGLLPDSLPGLPSRLVSLLFGLAALAVLGRTAFRWVGALPAALLVLGLALHPAFITAGLDGGDATAVACFTLLYASSWCRWVLEDRLTHLSVMSLSAALLCLTRFEMLGWTAAGALFVCVHEATAPRLPGQRQAIVILGLLPWVYGVGLWVLGNWLIMGDAFYFLRGLGQLNALAAQPFPSPALPAADPAWLLQLLFPALLLAAALVKREFAGLSLALMAFAAAGVAAGLDALGCLWDAPVILLPLTVLCLAALARLASLITERRSALRACLAAGGIAIPLLLLILQPPGWEPARGPGPAPLQEENRRMLAEIRDTVDAQTPFPTVYICGYESFPILDGNDDPVFIRELDFDFARAAKEYAGRSLYLLVPRPDGRGATESIHRKFRDIYAAGFANTLHTADFGPWRLFELVENPRQEEP